MKRSRFVLLVALAALPPRAAAAADTAAAPVPRAVVKLITGDPALAGYLHPERPGRLPLLISDSSGGGWRHAILFRQPVRFMSDAELKTLPHLRFRVRDDR
jgi:hypothetical protein